MNGPVIGIEESFFQAILYPEGVTDPVLRKLVHAFKHVWKQAAKCEVSSETYRGVRHIFNQAWIECSPVVQEKWEFDWGTDRPDGFQPSPPSPSSTFKIQFGI